jgi:hypothetical protein
VFLTFQSLEVVKNGDAQRAGLAAGLEFMMSCPEPLLNKDIKVQVN